MHPIWRQAESVRNESGAVVIDGQHVAATVRCCHCGTHWIAVRGSGVKRGWCMECRAVTCGDSLCRICVPIEVRLEAEEGRIDPKYKDRLAELYGRFHKQKLLGRGMAARA